MKLPGAVFSSGEVCRLLSVSPQRVRALRKAGKLHPFKGGDGNWYFDQAEVERVASERARSTDPRTHKPKVLSDEIETQCFEMFEMGTPLAHVVIQLRVSAELVLASYSRWERMRGPAPAPPKKLPKPAPDDDELEQEHKEVLGRLTAGFVRNLKSIRGGRRDAP